METATRIIPKRFSNKSHCYNCGHYSGLFVDVGCYEHGMHTPALCETCFKAQGPDHSRAIIEYKGEVPRFETETVTGIDSEGGDSILWHAYCLDCKALLTEPCPNGMWADAAANNHIQAKPTHKVLVAYQKRVKV